MNQKIKISQLPAKGSNLAAADLLEIAEFTGTGYISKSITGQEIIDAIPAPSVDWGDIGGTLSDQTDLNTALSGKVPTSRTLTINGTTQDLSADRTFTISTGITIGTTAIASGTVGRVLFEGTGNVVQESANLFWDNTNGRLGVGTSSPISALDLFGNVGLGSASAVGLNTVSGRITFKNGANNTRIESVQVDASFPQNQRLDFYPHTSNAAAFQVGFSGITSVLNHNFTANALLTASSSVTFAHTSGVSEGIRFDAITKRIRLNSYYISLEGNTSEVFQATDGTNVLMRLRGNGNLLINTTTDAGFRLDVNGTARVQGQITTTTANAQFGAIGAATGEFRIDGVNGAALAFSVYSSNTLRFGVTGYGGVTTNNNSLDLGTNFLNARSARFGTSGANATIDLQSQSGVNPMSLKISNGTTAFFVSTSGNVLINTTTDAGFKLDVNGTARVKSTGNTSATTGFTILNSSSTAWFSVRDDGRIQIGTTGAQTFVQGATTFQAQTAADNMVVFQGGLTTGTFFRTYLSGTDYPLEANANGLTIRSSGNTAQNSSSILDVQSTTRGFLPPRMTTTQKNAIATPATGLQIYDTTLNRPCFYDGTTWITL